MKLKTISSKEKCKCHCHCCHPDWKTCKYKDNCETNGEHCQPTPSPTGSMGDWEKEIDEKLGTTSRQYIQIDKFDLKNFIRNIVKSQKALAHQEGIEEGRCKICLKCTIRRTIG